MFFEFLAALDKMQRDLEEWTENHPLVGPPCPMCGSTSRRHEDDCELIAYTKEWMQVVQDDRRAFERHLEEKAFRDSPIWN